MVKSIGAALGLAMMFCGGTSGEGVDGGVPHSREDAGAGDDAGFAEGDASAGQDAGGAPLGEYDPSIDRDDALAACFDGADNDGDTRSDCADASCRANVPACCVGTGAAECCVAGTPRAVPIEACEGSVVACAALAAVATWFGSPSPEVVTFAGDDAPSLVPRGDANDSGLLFHEVVDTNGAAVTLRASIAAAGAEHAAGNDVIALGLTDVASTLGLLRVEPIVALLVSGNRAELDLVVAGEIVERVPVLDGAFHEYELKVSPGGVIELLRDGEPMVAPLTLPIDRPLRPVLYGRTFNPSPSDPPPVRVRGLSIGADACDVPSALGPPTAPLALGVGAAWDAAAHVAGPSVVQWTDEAGAHDLLAVEIDGAIYLASRQGDGYALTSAIGSPSLTAGEPWSDRLSDPVLRRSAGALELWATAWEAGAGAVVRVRASAGPSFAWADAEIVLDPSAHGATSFEQPAPFEAEGRALLAVRAKDGAGGDRLELYRALSAGWERVGALRETSPDDVLAFDRDELGAPAVIHAGGAYRMFFAGRRGSRWSIGLLVSADGLTWREPENGALVYGGSGSGFDALGARDPEPVIEGAAFRLYYTGNDGARTRLGVALGAAPPPR